MMLELIEADPLPEVCQRCPDEFCDECEHMMERWPIPPEDWRRLAGQAKERAIARLRRELERIKD